MQLIVRTRTAARSASVAHRNAHLPPSSSQDFYNLDYLNVCPTFNILRNSCGWEMMWAGNDVGFLKILIFPYAAFQTPTTWSASW